LFLEIGRRWIKTDYDPCSRSEERLSDYVDYFLDNYVIYAKDIIDKLIIISAPMCWVQAYFWPLTKKGKKCLRLFRAKLEMLTQDESLFKEMINKSDV